MKLLVTFNLNVIFQGNCLKILLMGFLLKYQILIFDNKEVFFSFQLFSSPDDFCSMSNLILPDNNMPANIDNGIIALEFD